MAFRGEATTEQLSKELVGGHNLNARLLALLRHPLDRRGQEAAVAMSQELSRVFKVSLFMLMSGDCGRVVEVDMLAAPVSSTPAKDKPNCAGEEAALPKKGTEAQVTEMEITASPDNDGYQWRKYGQKNIRNRNFARCYYKCMFSHDRGCRAKKTVQQQDNSRGRHPMFEVRYMNEHKCQRAVPDETISSAATLTTTKKNSHHFDPLHAQLENDIMASCLAMVIGGAAPAGPSSLLPVEEASLGDPDSGHAPRLLDVGMDIDATKVAAEISRGSPFSPADEPPAPSSSSFLPKLLAVEASPSDTSANLPAGGGHSWSMDPISMEDTFFLCGPLFSSVAAQSISQLD